MTELNTSGPHVARLADRVWEDWLAREPSITLKPVAASSVAQHSLEDAAAAADSARTFLTEIDRLAATEVTHTDVVTLEHLRWLTGTWSQLPQRHLYELPIAPYVLSWRTAAMSRACQTQDFADASDVDRYMMFAASCASSIQEIARTVRHQAAHGIRVPRPAHAGAVRALEATRGRMHDMLVPHPDRLQELGRAASQGLVSHVQDMLERSVDPAFAALFELLDGDYRDAEPEEVGLGLLPGGADYYDVAVRRETTLDYDADEIHRRGLDDVASLETRLGEMRGRLGVHGDLAEFQRAMVARGRLIAADAGQVETTYRAFAERAMPRVSELFRLLPEAAWDVARLPLSLEPDLTYGYFSHATDATKTGTYLFNGSQLDERPMIGVQALMLHELMPGHHLQFARQVEQLDLPAVRREPVLSISAFIEGWGEYAAGLGWEMGLYDDDVEAFGRLTSELFFAQRLVLDTGLNARGWGAERASAYLQKGTVLSASEAASEILRYSTDLPAQALGYRLGSGELYAIRERARGALGQDFDIQEFHERVLREGALPLQLVSRNIDAWVEEGSRTG